MSEYTEQANKFMENCGATMAATFLCHAPHFKGDDETRDIYHITLARPGNGGFKMEFDFGQSLANSKAPEYSNNLTEYWRKYHWKHQWQVNGYGGNHPQNKRKPPTAYDVLACLTKYEVSGDVWEFAREFGYEIDSRESFNRVDKIHMSVIQEYRDVCKPFGDVMEQLCEIS